MAAAGVARLDFMPRILPCSIDVLRSIAMVPKTAPCFHGNCTEEQRDERSTAESRATCSQFRRVDMPSANDLPDVLETPEPERLATGFVFTEGPLWHPDGYWYFVDLRCNQLLRLTAGKEPEVV